LRRIIRYIGLGEGIRRQNPRLAPRAAKFITLSIVGDACSADSFDPMRSTLVVLEGVSTMELPAVRSFLSSMARLGEPFVTGFVDPVALTGSDSWSLIEDRCASDVLGINEPVLREYRFALLGVKATQESLTTIANS
jgi:hypothetical protein